MLTKLKAIAFIFLVFSSHLSYSQSTNKEMALEKGRAAIKLMDDGKIDESIRLLEEAQKLDPDKFDWRYELAYAYYSKEDYKGAIKILESNINHKDVSQELYQLLGNSYDILGNSEKAMEVYDAGLKKFPASGALYLEKGNVYWNKKDYGKALPFYEKGIVTEPEFPSNYYRAALIFCNSSEEVWGLIYGEIFMNLERNSKRTAEISKLLFDTYKSQIKIDGSSMKVDFCNIVMNADDISNKDKIKLPFCMVFGQAFIVSIINVKTINLTTLDSIRTTFIKNYYQMGHDKLYPNILFAYQDQLLKSGNLEAYNHWILMKGDEDEFNKWHSGNKEKWDNFVKWFTDNELKVDNSNRFYRGQY